MKDEIQIGLKLKHQRKRKGISISSLSKKSGVSTGQISQIEQGKTIPSVISLYKLASALNVDLNYFFEEENSYVLQKAGERRVVITNEGRNRYEILSPTETKNHKMDFTIITLQPHSVYEGEKPEFSHEGEECGYILSGAMVVNIDEERVVLNEGDSIYFSSAKLHCYENPFDEECVSIWAMTPLFF